MRGLRDERVFRRVNDMLSRDVKVVRASKWFDGSVLRIEIAVSAERSLG